jgi:hypothetical protein
MIGQKEIIKGGKRDRENYMYEYRRRVDELSNVVRQ